MDNTSNTNFNIPLAIIVAGVLVAGAVIYVGFGGNGAGTPNTAAVDAADEPSAKITMSADDHILGNPNAPVVLVEFSDLECPYCKTFHNTLKQVMKEYGDTGQVAWVYKHFPIDSIHPKARTEAQATECAGELGGHVKFWEFTDKVFEITPSNNGLDFSLLPKIATDIGLDKTAFEACLAGSANEKIQNDTDMGLAAGAQGTPFTVILTKDGAYPTPINGAQTFETVKTLIDKVLAETK